MQNKLPAAPTERPDVMAAGNPIFDHPRPNVNARPPQFDPRAFHTRLVPHFRHIWQSDNLWDSRHRWMPRQLGGGKWRLAPPQPWTVNVKTREAKLLR
jgi:hypothetical protein